MRHPTITSRIASRTWLLLCLVGCGSEYGVRLSFLDSEDRAAAARIELALIESCGDQLAGDSPVRPIQRIEFANGPTDTAVGSVESGSYGLYARAIDSSCQVVAAGCTPVELESNGDATLSVELASTSRPRCPAAATCDDGQCIGVVDSGVADSGVVAVGDSGVSDASLLDAPDSSDSATDASDAGPRDAGLVDAGGDTQDAGPPGPLVYISCDNLAVGVPDESGNGRHAECVLGCPEIVSGAVGNACSFDGSGQHIRIANDPAFDTASGFSVAGWARIRSVRQQSPFALPFGSSALNTWQLFLSAPRASFISSDGVGSTGPFDAPLPIDTWRHYTLVFTGTEMRFYIDGVFGSSEAGATSGVFDGLHDIFIGGDENAGALVWPLDGDVDEFRLYDRVLSADEILALFNEGA